MISKWAPVEERSLISSIIYAGEKSLISGLMIGEFV